LAVWVWSNEELALLVQPDGCIARCTPNPAIFELEMERIFGRAWLISGMKARSRAGDYFPTPAWAASR